MENNAAKNAEEIGKKLSKAYKEPSAIEANATYFIILFFMTLTPLIGKLLFPVFNQTAAITLAVLFFAGLIITFIFAEIKKGKRSSRLLYYTTYLFSVLALMFCMLAVNLFHNIFTDIKTLLIIVSVSGIASLLIFAIYSFGKFERFFSLLLCLLFIGSIIAGAILWSDRKLDIGITVVFLSLGFLLLQMAFSLYIFSNSSFFTIMAGFTVILVGIALVIALMVIGGDGDCDCGGCDCGDLGANGGTRRNKTKFKPPLIK